MSPSPTATLALRRSPLRGVSLRVVLLGSLAAVIVATLVLVSLTVVGLMRQSAERERRQAASMLATAAAHTLEHGGSTAADQLLARWRADGLIESHRLLRLDDPAALSEEPLVAALAAAPDTGPRTRLAAGGAHRHIVAAEAVGGEPRRVVVLELSLARFDQQIAGAQGLVLLYGVLIGLTALAVGYLLVTRSIVRPVRRLVHATERVGAGDLETRIAVGGLGEVAELAERFNSMVEAVGAARDETRRGLCELEEANRELREANQTIERARDELVRAERLASVGALAAGVAHEIGNPVASVLACVELLRDEPDLSPQERDELLRRTDEATRRIHRIIRELLDYSRAEASEIAPLDPRAAVEQALRLVAPQPRLRHVRLEDEVPRDLPHVPLDESRLVQVLVNLVLNAADALSDHTPADGARARITLGGERQADAVVLRVSDNGPGISPEVLPHIFEPFFTTRAPGRGTGLGLAICERLTTRMGATLAVDTSDAGTTFTLRFPLRSADVHAHDPEDAR